MPESSLPRGLLSTARRLSQADAKRPTQANLRRSISTAYYAAFHALAKMCADSLVGTAKSSRPNKAWIEVYRGLVHGTCKDACKRAKSINFPNEIKDFAEAFAQLQDLRHEADYNPAFKPSKEDAQLAVDQASRIIGALTAAQSKDRKAFATWVLITSPGAVQARKRG